MYKADFKQTSLFLKSLNNIKRIVIDTLGLSFGTIL